MLGDRVRGPAAPYDQRVHGRPATGYPPGPPQVFPQQIVAFVPLPPPPPPPPRRRLTVRLPRRLTRRMVPLIGLALVAVLTADLVALTQLPAEPRSLAGHSVVVRQESTPGATPTPTPRAGYVAPAGESARPTVAPLGKRHQPHLFVVAPGTIPAATLRRVRALKGVAAVETVDAAEVSLDGKRVRTMGVDPSTFRAFTPSRAARSDALWANVAAGEVAVSFVLGKDGGVGLGSTVRVSGGGTLRVGAWATMGMGWGVGSIDAVVSHDTARALGIPGGNALVVSAPKVDSRRLRARLLKRLPKGSQVATINPVLIVPKHDRTTTRPNPRPTAEPRPQASTGPQRPSTWPAGSLMSADQLKTMLTAAASKVGRPYVWGAEGPDAFDCSGLVQWAFAQAGVRMPRVTNQQWATGPQVPLDQAQPGDLLFWRNDPTNPGYISHVAIYWGDGKMLHAPHTGDVVKIAPIYMKGLAGVVRVSPQVAARVR